MKIQSSSMNSVGVMLYLTYSFLIANMFFLVYNSKYVFWNVKQLSVTLSKQYTVKSILQIKKKPMRHVMFNLYKCISVYNNAEFVARGQDIWYIMFDFYLESSYSPSFIDQLHYCTF